MTRPAPHRPFFTGFARHPAPLLAILVLNASTLAGLIACNDREQKSVPATVASSMALDRAAEQRVLQRMVTVLDEHGLGFDAAPPSADAERQRALLELQTRLQTEIALARKRLQQSEPNSPKLSLLDGAREALDQHVLAEFIRKSTRPEPGSESGAALLFTELESNLRKTIQSRAARLGEP